jgi:hypothetical protein
MPARALLAPIILGSVLLVLVVAYTDYAAALFAIITLGGPKHSLVMTRADLAVSSLMFDARPCWPIIGCTAPNTLPVNPVLRLMLGTGELGLAAMAASSSSKRFPVE